MEIIITVKGEIPAGQFGAALPHEHIMVDFIGAGLTGKHRYEPEEVISVMLPHLEALKNRKVTGFVECTPMFLARDPEILLTLSQKTGIHILTNTGQYKEPFLPEETFRVTAEELAESWIREFEEGIASTGIRPGFIKTAVFPEPLKPVQQKIIHAAALTSRETGMTIATHTGMADQAMEILGILELHGVDPSKWIFVHAQNEDDMQKLLQAADSGCWIGLDGISENSSDRHLASLTALLDKGRESQILLSHDAGWYKVGEPNGGEQRPFTYLVDTFIPRMTAAGIPPETIDRIIRVNPGKAYSICRKS